MQVTKEEIIGVLGTALFAILLMLLLLFSYFTLASLPDDLEGIPVMFGTADEAFGVFESPMIEPIPTPVNREVIPEYAPDEPFITQTTEPTIDLEAQREEERRRREQAEERRRVEEAERKRLEDERRQREINQQMSGLFGESNESRGSSEGEGSAGVSTGSASEGSPIGKGGIGTYDLGGRSLGSGGLVQPRYTVNDYGTVVINITVDPAGNVIHANIGRGTNTSDATLRNEALAAAKATKFNAISSPNNQQGTITYRFKLN